MRLFTLLTSLHPFAREAFLNSVLFTLCITSGLAQSFQKNYGTPFDNSFSKVIQDGSEYYVLGQDQPASGMVSRATITRLASDGSLLWTRSLDIASQWNDGLLIAQSGDLLVVGNSLPGDATAKSLMGRITSLGVFNWVREYDEPNGRDFFLRIIENPIPDHPAFPYYVIGGQKDPSISSATWDDVVLLNINENGNFNWKKIYVSVDDDEFLRDMEVLPNGNLVISGSKFVSSIGGSGVLLMTNNQGNLIAGKTVSQMGFTDMARQIGGGGFYAIANPINTTAPFLSKFDANFNLLWQVQMPTLITLKQVWEGSPGTIYLTGTGTFGGLLRTVIIKINDNSPNAPTHVWTKYLNSGTNFVGGSSWIMPSNEMAFTDGRILPGGFGGLCAFFSLSDLELNTCMVNPDSISLVPTNLLPSNQTLHPINLIDTIKGVDLTNTLLMWADGAICQSCCADSSMFSSLVSQGFTIVISNCKVTVTAPQFDSCYLFSTPPALDGGNVPQVITNPNGSWTYDFTQNGAHQICVNVFDECNSKKMCSSFNVVACDTCVCGPFDLMYAISRGPLLPKNCGDTLFVPSSGTILPIRFITSFNCIGTHCPQASVDWILTGPAGFLPMSMNGIPATPSFAIPITNATFTIAGLYTLTMIGHCGKNQCPCTIYFMADGPDCCTNRPDFEIAIQNAASLIVDNVNCKATFNIGNLPSCDSIGPILWGDGSSTSGPFSSGSMSMHTYSSSGTYVITWLAREYDNSVMPARLCFEKRITDTIKINCLKPDSCNYKPCLNSSWQNIFNTTFIYDMIVYQGQLIVAGSFNIGGANNIAAWNGTTWSALGSGINGTVEALEVHSGLLYAGGSFTSPGNNLAVWNGINWSSVGGGTNGTVHRLLSYNANLIAGGLFSIPASNIAQWNGINWNGLGSGTNGMVTGLGRYNADLIVGGIFSLAGGNTVSNIAQWNGTWSTLSGGGINLFPANKGQGVSAIQQLNADLIVGGRFMDAAGVTGTSFIAQWNGSNWTSMAGGVNTSLEGIYDLKLFGGELYAGGLFNKIGNNPIDGVAHWNGSNWLSVSHPNQLVRSLACYMAPGKTCDVFSAGEVFLNHWACVTSSDETLKADFRIYPNPATGDFIVDMEEPASVGTYLRISDLWGRIVMVETIRLGSKSQQIDASQIPNGIYFLQVYPQGKRGLMEKFIKQ